MLRQQDIALDLAHSARSAAELRRDLDRCPAAWAEAPKRGGRKTVLCPGKNHGKRVGKLEHLGKIIGIWWKTAENEGKPWEQGVNYDEHLWKRHEIWENIWGACGKVLKHKVKTPQTLMNNRANMWENDVNI